MNSGAKRRKKEVRRRNDQQEYKCFYCESNECEEEVIALTNPLFLSLYDDINNDCIERPQHRVGHFLIHDEHNYLCSFDCGKIEKGMNLYLCGIIEPIYCDAKHENDKNNGIKTKMIGPLGEWWFAGFDGGSEVIIGVESPFASYILSHPHVDYEKIFMKASKKILITKIVIESISTNPDASFEELMDCIKERNQEFTQESLMEYASFIIDQIQSYDNASDEDEIALYYTQAMQDLISFAGYNNNNSMNKTKCHLRSIARIDTRRFANSDSFTTSTPFVRQFFDTIFNEVIEKDDSCSKEYNSLLKRKNCLKQLTESEQNRINWIGEMVLEDKIIRRSYYKCVKVNDEFFSLGDFAMISRLNNQQIGRIIYMFQGFNRQKMCHIHWFCDGKGTILGETIPNSILFMTNKCEDVSICEIIYKCNVNLMKNFNNNECVKEFVCHKLYHADCARFEDLPEGTFEQDLKCQSCIMNETVEMNKIPKLGQVLNISNENMVRYKSVEFNGHLFSTGECALISENAFKMDSYTYNTQENEETECDESIFSEKYRKSFSDYLKGSYNDVPQAFHVGFIKEIIKYSDDPEEETKIIINKFYRPINVFEEYEDYHKCDINLLFWSNEEITIKADELKRKCEVIYCDESPNTNFYLKPYLFYFSEAFDSINKSFYKPVIEICDKFLLNDKNDENYPQVKKMKLLDLFAGCGGLAYGFEQIKLASKLWAIEKDPSPAKSFRLNFPSSIVFEDDANHILRLVLDGVEVNDEGQKLPKKGEVDFILGGPPCQGFSGMNRFSSRQYSLFKNSLIVSFLSFVDFYRPKFVLFENVRNFALFKRSMILKLTLSCLTMMGYQSQFAILQAGSYGVPQTRRRTVIIAAAPGYKLPHFPQPTHVFSLRQCQTSVTINENKYAPQLNTSAPFREIRVDDAIDDLPPLQEDYALDIKRTFVSPESCHFQKLCRTKGNEINDHVCKELNALCLARIQHIPKCEGADWRDLPNIRHPLPDGTIVQKLQYNYEDTKNGRSKNNQLRGVCACASNQECRVLESRQENTLIPWCLVHTANRHYQWSGLYGRLSWKGYFATTVTNPEPISKQGRILHPQQDRIVSVREMARSQGFPDDFNFTGTVLDRYRQIGNAVPVPLSIAIAIEFHSILS